MWRLKIPINSFYVKSSNFCRENFTMFVEMCHKIDVQVLKKSLVFLGGCHRKKKKTWHDADAAWHDAEDKF